VKEDGRTEGALQVFLEPPRGIEPRTSSFRVYQGLKTVDIHKHEDTITATFSGLRFVSCSMFFHLALSHNGDFLETPGKRLIAFQPLTGGRLKGAIMIQVEYRKWKEGNHTL
jgi:hypothetical protein